MAKPWRKLFRKLVDNPMYFSEPFDKTHAWIDLILMAEDDGVVRTTVPMLSTRWKWSEGKVRRFLKAFAEDGAIEYQGKGGRDNGRDNGRVYGMFVSLVNWDIYQGERKENGRVNDRVNGRVSSRGDNLSNNNIINIKRDKEDHTLVRDTDFESEFNEVWSKYPKKNGRQNALRDYIKARKSGVNRETIESGLDAYIDECSRLGREKQFIADGSTWFHQCRWDWDYSAQPVTGKKEETMEERIERWRREGLWDHG